MNRPVVRWRTVQVQVQIDGKSPLTQRFVHIKEWKWYCMCKIDDVRMIVIVHNPSAMGLNELHSQQPTCHPKISAIHSFNAPTPLPIQLHSHASTFTCGTHGVTTVETQKAILWHHTPDHSDNTMPWVPGGWMINFDFHQSPEITRVRAIKLLNIEIIVRNFSQPTHRSSYKPWKLIWIPSWALTYPTNREKENHLQKGLGMGYVSSLQINCMPKSKFLQIWDNDLAVASIEEPWLDWFTSKGQRGQSSRRDTQN